MAQKLIVSNFQTGLETDLPPFKLNNDAFTVLNNAKIYRDRVIKKPGTQSLNNDMPSRLQRDLTSESFGLTGASPWAFNLGTALGDTGAEFIPSASNTIVLGGAITFTDDGAGVLSSVTPGNSGTINYSTGAVTLTHTAGVGASTAVTISYYPCLPVLGIEEFVQGVQNPDSIFFDQKYSYRFNQTAMLFYDVSFYKGTQNPLVWSGADYEQFWGVSYRNALWVTNNKPGMHFLPIVSTTLGAITNVQVTNHGLSSNDRVFFNELLTATELNGRSAQITFVDANNFTVPITTAANNGATGIIQLLTSSQTNTKDGIRYYDGDPTAGMPPSNNGWVNFAPPLQNTGLTGAAPEYLVGALAIVPFKDRLLMFGIWTQLVGQDPVLRITRMAYSQNGTPYYIDDPNFLPLNQRGQGEAWFQNVPARGGFLNYFQQEPFVNASPDGDILICQFQESQARLIFSQDDSFPFYYQTIDNELGTFHTFSGIPMDRGVASIGQRGIIFTAQNSAKRFDEKIPDSVFLISKFNNDEKRVTAIRDYEQEMIYWAYTPQYDQDDESVSHFPTRIFGYNYRNGTWFTEDCHFTHFGYFSKNTSYTWATLPFDTWAEWTNPWNYGGTGERSPDIVGGDMQGFVRLVGKGGGEDASHRITTITGNTITSPNHDMLGGDYIVVESGTGITSNGLPMPSTVRTVISIVDEDNFTVDGEAFVGTLTANGIIKKIVNYDITTKMFDLFTDLGMGTEFGEHKYRFSRVPGGQTSIYIYTNTNDGYAVNTPGYDNYTPVTNILSTDGGNLFFNRINQSYVWTQYSGAFSGNTIQVQFKLSDAQMKNPDFNEKDFALHSIVIDVTPGAEN